MICSFFRRPSARLLLAAMLLLPVGTGCSSFFNRIGTGTHLDAAQEHPYDTNRKHVYEMVMEVTTNASGEVVDIHFQRSSGRDGLDGFVAQSVRNTWPPNPSMRSVVSVKYSGEKGLFEPKVISSTPVG